MKSLMGVLISFFPFGRQGNVLNIRISCNAKLSTTCDLIYKLHLLNSNMYWACTYLASLCCIVGWSPDGEFIAVTRKNLISILSSKFEEKFGISLAFKSLLDDSNAKCIIKGILCFCVFGMLFLIFQWVKYK